MSQTTLPRPCARKYTTIDTPVSYPVARSVRSAPLPFRVNVMLNGLESPSDRQASGSSTTTFFADLATSALRELDVPSTAAESKRGGPETEPRDRPQPIYGPYQPYLRSGATSAGPGRRGFGVSHRQGTHRPTTTRPDSWCRDLFSQTAT